MKTNCLLIALLLCAFMPAQEKLELHRFSFSSQGQQLNMAYVYEKPLVKSKATVLLLHGKNFSFSYWQTTITYLTGQGYTVVAPDQPGFGQSSQPQGYQYTFQQLAKNTKLLLDSIGISKVIVLGHSMGGMLGVRFALMYPETCEKLILENPIGLEDWKTKIPYSSVDEEYAKELKKTRDDLKTYMQKNYFHDTWKKEYEELLDESAKPLTRSDFKLYAKNMALTSDMIFTQPVCYEFENLKLPVVLIIGQKDKTAIGKERADAQTAAQLGNYPELGRKTKSAISNSQLMELEGIGHVPHVEDFKAFSEALLKSM